MLSLYSYLFLTFFIVSCSCGHPELHVLTHSFPTRRSSDLGQAAASPRAQVVWPATCLVTWNNVSISLASASPVRSRSITRHIQPVPSRHGVDRKSTRLNSSH